MGNLMQAHRQWASRPDDERFWTLDDMKDYCNGIRMTSVQGAVEVKDLSVISTEDNDIRLQGKSRAATLGHYAFGQLSRMIGAPADYLRSLPAPLAAECMNSGMRQLPDQERGLSLLCRKSGIDPALLHVRAALSQRYTRIWNGDILQRLQDALPAGWQVPPARPASNNAGGNTRIATEADVLRSSKRSGAGGIGVKVGDTIAPAGLYASDKDMFAFLVNEDNPVEVGGNPLYRGFFVWNSEVGDSSFGILTFLYNSVCGNHIVWDARRCEELSIRHVGEADNKAWGSLKLELKRYSEQGVADVQSRIISAKSHILGNTKDDVITALFSKRFSHLTKGEISDSLEYAEKFPADHGNANPRSAWAVSQGMTRFSQTRPYADDRVRLDRTAGKILELVF